MNSIEKRAKEEGEISQYRSEYPYDKTSVEFGYMAGAYDQKYIDEKDIEKEVRFTKSTDITPEECDREVAFLEWFHKHRKGIPTYSDAIEWSRKEVINKVREYLHHIKNIVTEVSIEEVRKLMEE